MALPIDAPHRHERASPNGGVTRLMQAENLLPADFVTAWAYTNELTDAINNFDAADL